MRACHSLSVNADLFVTPAGYPAPVDEIGDLDSTLIIYISGDNGASLEGTATGSFNELTMLNGLLPDPNQQTQPYLGTHGTSVSADAPGSPGHWTTTPGPRAETPGHTHVGTGGGSAERSPSALGDSIRSEGAERSGRDGVAGHSPSSRLTLETVPLDAIGHGKR